MINKNLKKSLHWILRHIVVVLSYVIIIILGITGLAYAMTTISNNIDTGGNLAVSGNATTTGWLNIGSTIPTNEMFAGDLFIGNNATTTGNLNVDGTTTFNNNVDYNTYKAIAMAVDNGTSFPGSVATGQWFYRTDRYTLYIYESSWKPIISFGEITFYVDNTDGTDGDDYGDSADSGAFQTIQYAINSIPPLYGGDVTINVNNETYNENVTIGGKNPINGYYRIFLDGTMTTESSHTATGGGAGTGATQATVEVSSAPWTTNSDQNLLISFDDDTSTATLQGIERIIDSNTTDTLTLVGTLPAAPQNGDTFEIKNWGTTIDASGATAANPALKILAYQRWTEPRYMKMTGSTNITVQMDSTTILKPRQCHITSGGNATIKVLGLSGFHPDTCFIYYTGSKTAINSTFSHLDSEKSKIAGSGVNNSTGVYLTDNQAAEFRDGSIVDNFETGIQLKNNASINFYSAAGNGYPRIRNATTGVQTLIGSVVMNNSNNQYSGNTTDEDISDPHTTYLRNDSNDTTTGILTMGGAVLNGPMTTDQNLTWWIGPGNVIEALSGTVSSTRIANSDTAAGDIEFVFPVPYQLLGATVVLDSITIYANTLGPGDYITRVSLLSSDLDGTQTTQATYGTDIGNGSSGDVNQNILSADHTMTDFPYYLVVDTEDNDVNTDVDVYGFKVVGHLE